MVIDTSMIQFNTALTRAAIRVYDVIIITTLLQFNYAITTNTCKRKGTIINIKIVARFTGTRMV